MKSKRPTSILELADEFAPPIARVLARDLRTRQPLTHEDIARRSGLPVQQVISISCKLSFATVPLGEVDRYLHGCGINLGNAWKHRRYLRRSVSSLSPLAHLDSTSVSPAVRTRMVAAFEQCVLARRQKTSA